MIWLTLVLIYLISFAIHILLVYLQDKRIIRIVGDIIDEIQPFMWFPIANTFLLILLGISFILDKIVHILKLSVLWEKFRNIKLK
jgi:hypothetical protein